MLGLHTRNSCHKDDNTMDICDSSLYYRVTHNVDQDHIKKYATIQMVDAHPHLFSYERKCERLVKEKDNCEQERKEMSNAINL